MSPLPTLSRQSGFGMIEVLVTLVILLVGLLGLAGLMAQGQRSEMESYQRVQALILVQDMVGRINANRNVAMCYGLITPKLAGAPYLGTAETYALPGNCTIGTAKEQAQFQGDVAAWNTLLLGAAESESSTNKSVGAMIDARGCVSYDVSTELPQLNQAGLQTGSNWPGTGIYTVSVAWQGIGDSAPNTLLLCGTGLYGNPPSDTKRRAVSMTFRIAHL